MTFTGNCKNADVWLTCQNILIVIHMKVHNWLYICKKELVRNYVTFFQRFSLVWILKFPVLEKIVNFEVSTFLVILKQATYVPTLGF